MKKFFFLFFLWQGLFCYAQEEVTLIVQGDGASKREAVDVALRSAIEQAFGVFVSTNTTILNDEFVKDEIASISSGNIKEYKELSVVPLPDGRTTVSLEATVSVGKLVKYVESKGGTCELKGSAFVAEIKQIKLKKDNARLALEHLKTQLQSILPSAYDYEINAVDIRSTGQMTVVFEAYLNENYYKCEDLIESTLNFLSLSSTEVKSLTSKGEKVYEYSLIQPNGYIIKKFYLYEPFEFDITQPIRNAITKNIIVDNLNHYIPLSLTQTFMPYYSPDNGYTIIRNKYIKSTSRTKQLCFTSRHLVRYSEDEMIKLTGFSLTTSGGDLLLKLYKDYLECVYKKKKILNSRGIPDVYGTAESYSKLPHPSLEIYFKLYRVGSLYYICYGDRYIKYTSYDAFKNSCNLKNPTSEFTKEWTAVENKYNSCCQSFAYLMYDESMIIHMIKNTFSDYLKDDSDTFLFEWCKNNL